MTIKSSGTQLSFSEIESEFGSNPGRSLGQYRSTDPNFQNKNLGSLSNLPLDAGIPTSGEIKFSDFYDKKLNLVVDYYDDTGSSGGEANNILNREDDGANTMAATWRYNNQSDRVKVVGGYRSRPTGTFSPGTYNLSSTAWGGGKKVFIHVNKEVGGVKSDSGTDVNKVSLRTGGWPSGTSLQIDIGSSGRLQGAGGNGRQGTTNGGTPAQAFAGSSGLGVEYPAQINNNGIIRCGYGGGGGGAGSNSDPNKSMTDYGRSGGGGGGGAGIPAGDGGPSNSGGYGGSISTGTAGQDGTFDAGGNQGNGFGVGADHGAGGGGGGNGGNGGDINDNPTGGSAGSPNVAGGGSAGNNGHGIIFSSNTVQSNSTGDKTIPSNEGGVIVGGVF
tara:strand:+ start:893 stop:2053 length:1161 start_codon:yes stop_codon:yes gene_type:complete